MTGRAKRCLLAMITAALVVPAPALGADKSLVTTVTNQDYLSGNDTVTHTDVSGVSSNDVCSALGYPPGGVGGSQTNVDLDPAAVVSVLQLQDRGLGAGVEVEVIDPISYYSVRLCADRSP